MRILTSRLGFVPNQDLDVPAETVDTANNRPNNACSLFIVLITSKNLLQNAHVTFESSILCPYYL
jgi:hypothetical protein